MTFAYHAEPFQYQSSVNFHSNWLAKIAWHTSTQIKYVFLKASNSSISNAGMESIFTKLIGFSTYKPWSKGEKLTIGLFFKKLIFCHSLNWINCTSYKCLEEKKPNCIVYTKAEELNSFHSHWTHLNLWADYACTSQRSWPNAAHKLDYALDDCRRQETARHWAQRDHCSCTLQDC